MGEYAYGTPTTTARYTGTNGDEFGSEELWAKAVPNLMPIINQMAKDDDSFTVGSEDYYHDVAQNNDDLNAASAAAAAASRADASRAAAASASRKRQYLNAAQILLQQRGKNPYAALQAALQKNAAAAGKTGSDAVAALKAALAQRQNPYANIQFNTPTAAANPLAAYMAQSGVATDQVDALRNLLQSWSADASSADQQMGDRLSTSWQNDQTSRLSDASTTEAAFKQALASNLMNQQGSLDAQYQSYYNDLSNQLAQLAMQSGYSLKDLGVTL